MAEKSITEKGTPSEGIGNELTSSQAGSVEEKRNSEKDSLSKKQKAASEAARRVSNYYTEEDKSGPRRAGSKYGYFFASFLVLSIAWSIYYYGTAQDSNPEPHSVPAVPNHPGTTFVTTQKTIESGKAPVVESPKNSTDTITGTVTPPAAKAGPLPPLFPSAAFSRRPMFPTNVRPAVRFFTSEAAFVAAAPNPLTKIDFDVASDGNPIDAPSPGVLAGTLFKGYGITFDAGVVFGTTSIPGRRNIITNSGINTPTPALVAASFASPVHEVGITNVGAEAVLRIFGEDTHLISKITAHSRNDFVGIMSGIPIYYMEYNSVGGIGFGGADLLFTQITP